MTGQGALPFVWQERYEVDNYIVASCNELAFTLLKHPDRWMGKGVVLVGPAFSGKTHLAHIFSEIHTGLYVDNASALKNAIRSDKDYIVVDGAERLLQHDSSLAETLFHLVNKATLGQTHILITANQPPNTWPNVLADLRSRLQAFQQVELTQPDEEIIKGTYQKLFQDRGLMVDNKVLDYLALRTERSYAGIQSIVNTLDTQALQQGRKITIPLIQKAELF
jgi:chromosomal replication initiation ATPase DnaA